MAKKRLVLDIDETEHARLLNEARAQGETLSNFVRARLGLPLLRQGVKRPAVGKVFRTKRAAGKKQPANA